MKAMERPIFVVGPPRCGTTLTARILGRHSGIFMPGETHFFHDVYARRATLGDPATEEGIGNIVRVLSTLYGRYNEPEDQRRIDRLFADPAVVDSFRGRCRDYGDVLAHFMGMQAKDAGKRRWGNHAPKDLFHVKEILEFFPEARIIVCVRDVRDFLVSYRDKWRATTAEHVERVRRLYHPVLTALLWKTSIRQAQRLQAVLPATSLTTIRYEDLVRDPERVVRRLCAFVGEEFEPGMLAVMSHNSSAGDSKGEHGIFTTSVGRWERDLDREAAYVAQQVAGQELAALGYERRRIAVDPAKVAWIMATTPAATVRALHANRRMRGPLLPYLWRRVASYVRAG